MSKSYVSMEQKICTVCGQKYSTNSILMDKRLRESLDPETITGYGLCEEHQRLHDEGYIALVAVDEEKSKSGRKGELTLENAYRTGEVAHVRRSVLPNIIKDISPETLALPMIFASQEIIGMLEHMQKAAESGE